jgi:hypothetical protein
MEILVLALDTHNNVAGLKHLMGLKLLAYGTDH